MSAYGLVPAARSPHDSGMTMYESTMAARAAAAAPNRSGSHGAVSGYRSDTPVYDSLLTEYRDGFRSVPGEAWSPHPAPRFAELGNSLDRYSLPGGSSGL